MNYVKNRGYQILKTYCCLVVFLPSVFTRLFVLLYLYGRSGIFCAQIMVCSWESLLALLLVVSFW